MSSEADRVWLVVVNDNQVLLGTCAVPGPMYGRLKPMGGKIKSNESHEVACKRHAFAEAGIKIEQLKPAGSVTVRLDGIVGSHTWAIYISSATSAPQDTARMHGHQRFPTDALPVDRLVSGVDKWLPLVLRGDEVSGSIVYGLGPFRSAAVKECVIESHQPPSVVPYGEHEETG